ncbi:MAG TPA: hypothetical protein VFS43_47835 [Polyangiaceae bacterium]|nr:hypothetical protein [Polyangiaceae bacterium]
MTRWQSLSLAAAALSLGACGSGDGDEAVGTASAPLTFWQDVAPVFYQRCVSCHREGGIAPFRLDDYESARTWAAASKEAVASRRMPPWLATADGSCNTFRDSAWLSDEEVRVIGAWADSERREGAPRADLAPPSRPGLGGAVEIASPEFTPEPLGTDYAESDEYRCFLVDPALAADRFLTGYDVSPGNDALVHHVLVIPVDPAAPALDGRTNLDVMTAYDADSPDRAGWPCFSGAGDGVTSRGIPVTWAPGQGAVDYPAGIGVRIPAGNLLVMQVHYNMADASLRGQSARTAVKLRLEERVEREGVFLDVDPFLGSLLRGRPDEVPAGLAVAPYDWEVPYEQLLAFQLGGEPIPYLDVYGVFPHMHERGLSLRSSLGRADGSEACTLDVPRWDFGWQLIYFYDEPLRFGPGDRLRATCTYDTRGMSAPLRPGWSTQDEMCLTGLLFALPPPAPGAAP